VTEPETFVLDRVDNPHPKMLDAAIEARRRARALGGTRDTFYWVGYLQAMADATGCSPMDLNRWIDRHSGERSFDGDQQAVALRLTRKPGDE
jgi:hypothetical protein